MMNNLNSVNAEPSGAVDLTKTDDVTSAVADTQQPAGDVANSENTRQVQSKEDNTRFAEMRRGKEAAEKELSAMKDTNKHLVDALNGLGYEGSQNEILEKLSAERNGLTVEEYRQREKANEERIMNDPRIVEAQKVIRERQFERDLSEIKAVYPDVDAKSVLELGDVYLAIMRNGGASPVDAYAAQLAHNKREAEKIPPSIGAVNTTTPEEKEFFTSEEVDKLSEKDLENPKIMEKVIKSMTKW